MTHVLGRIEYAFDTEADVDPGVLQARLRETVTRYLAEVPVAQETLGAWSYAEVDEARTLWGPASVFGSVPGFCCGWGSPIF